MLTQEPRRSASPLVAMTALVVALALAVPLAAVLISSGGDDGAVTAQGGGTQTLEVELGDLYVKPASVQVPVGTELVVKVTNKGAMAHDLKLQGGETGTGMLQPGAT